MINPSFRINLHKNTNENLLESIEKKDHFNDLFHYICRLKKQQKLIKVMSEKIRIENGKLFVPDNPLIPYIEGDGIGVDIWPVSQKVFDAAVEKAYKGKRKITWHEVLAGEKAFKLTGSWLPQETLDTIKEYLFAIKGPLTTPVGGGIRSLNVALRQQLDLYTCLRPVKYYPGVPSPVCHPEQVDMVIFRENTEDIYAGIEFMQGTPEVQKLIKFLQKEFNTDKIRFPETSSIGIKPVSLEGTERLVRAALEYAVKYKRKSVSIVHKGNIMKFTEGSFKNWGYELAEREFGDHVFTWAQYDRIAEASGSTAANKAQDQAIKAGKIIVKDVIADNFLQQIQLRPNEYDVIATLNLNGDYISDALAAQVGGIGIAPGANINYLTGHAVFEATHGTAPKYAGLDKVNPSSVILSGAIMFDYMEWDEAAQLIHNGITGAIASKKVTYDFARDMKGSKEVSCSQFGNEIIKNFNYNPKAKEKAKKAKAKAKAKAQKTVEAKPVTKKASAKKAVAKKLTAKKTSAKKASVSKSVAKKTSAKKAVAKKVTAKKAVAKKVVSKAKIATKKLAVKKLTAKKASAKKIVAKKSASKKTASKGSR